jgi:transposase
MQVYIGIDWSENKHDVVFMNPSGAAVARLTIPHAPEGFLQLDQTRQDLGVTAAECLVAIETAHNLLIDFLWSRGYSEVYIISPAVVKSTRGRYGHSGARSDQQDASLLADLLRTDRARFRPWHPDSLLTRQIRAKVSFIAHLTRQVTRNSNRLRAVLLRYYPAALAPFSSLRSQIALEFIRAYPTPQAVQALTWPQFRDFAAQHAYKHPRRLSAYLAQLQAPHPEATPDTVLVYQGEAVLLAEHLLLLVRAKAQALRELQVLFEQHPDASTFASLPGTGPLLAPALLAYFGDDRARFPRAENVQSLAGTCPVTDSSGKRKIVRFRYACNREFRAIAQQWAKASLSESTWANAYWHQIRTRCRSNSHAYRCLANRWLSISWKLWQAHQTYDESYHLQQRAQRSRARRPN